MPPVGYDGSMCETTKLQTETCPPLQLPLRACLITVAAAVLSCGSATLFADEVIKPIVDAWQSRADEVHTVRFKAEATVLIPKGALGPMIGSSADSLTGPISYPIDEGSIDYPLEDETYEDSVEGLIDFQNNKLRISTHYHAFDAELHQFIPQFKVEYFNGNRTVETRPRAENTSEKYTPYKYETEAFIRPQNEALGVQEILPIFFSC